MSDKFPIAVLISGGGTTLANLIERSERGELPIEIRKVISSNQSAGGLQIAASHGIPTEVVVRRANVTSAEFSNAIFAACRQDAVRLVVMGGFLKHLWIPDDFVNRIVNIHPSLIPAFCGKGFYGPRVHQAVLEYGVKITGCTVHFVDNHYDHGPIILQTSVPVLADDTVERLAKRVFAEECEALPSAIAQIAAGNVKVAGRLVKIAK